MIFDEFKSFFQILEKVSLNPNIEQKKDDLFHWFPINWNYNQIYNILYFASRKSNLADMCFIFIDTNGLNSTLKENESSLKITISEILLVNIRKVYDKEICVSLDFETKEDFNGNTFFENNQDFIKILEEKISLNESIKHELKEKIRSILPTQKNSIIPIVIPNNIKDILRKLKVPKLNSDLLGSLSKFIDVSENLEDVIGKTHLDLIYTTFSNILDEKIPQIVTKIIFNQINNPNFGKWAMIFTSMFEELMLNLIIIDTNTVKNKTNIILGARIIIENGKLTTNPLPSHILIPYTRETTEENTEESIAKEIFEKTGVRTSVSNFDDILELIFEMYTSKKNILNALIDFTGWHLTQPWYPDSYINSFLKIFGMELGEDFKKTLNASFKVVLEYFSDIIIITYRISPIGSSKKSYLTLIHLGIKNGEIFIQFIDSKSYNKYLLGEYLELSPVERIKKIKEQIQKDTNIDFKGCFGFDVNILSEIISPKNIESLLKIKNMSRQLPLIATISALFAGMKALNVEEAIERKGSLLKLSESMKKTMEEQEEESKTVAKPLQFKKFFDSYLKRGIVFISDESRTMKQIRRPLFSKEGYLGLDLELIQDLIKKKNQ